MEYTLICDSLFNFVQVYKECIQLRKNREDARLQILVDVLKNQKEGTSEDFANIELDVKILDEKKEKDFHHLQQ